MAIRFDCEFCGKTLKADDSKAGKKVKCPSCEGLLTIPSLETESEPEIYDAEDAQDSDSYQDMDELSDAPAGKIPCPMCGEMKSRRAKVCPWCGDGSSKKKGKYPLAGPGKRLLGAIADGLAGMVFVGPGVVLFIAGNPEENGNNQSPLLIVGLLLLLFGALALLIVQLYLLINRSQSIGKYLVKTQIFDYETKTPAGFVKTFLMRGVVNAIIGAVPCVGPIYSLLDPLFVFSEEHRCLHDQIAGTYVVDIS